MLSGGIRRGFSSKAGSNREVWQFGRVFDVLCLREKIGKADGGWDRQIARSLDRVSAVFTGRIATLWLGPVAVAGRASRFQPLALALGIGEIASVRRADEAV
jgi:hypothetical protein